MIERRGGSRPAFTLEQAPQVPPLSSRVSAPHNAGYLPALASCCAHAVHSVHRGDAACLVTLC